MSHKNVIRAWKDSEYLESLSEAERALTPANPAGRVEITDAELAHVSGASAPGTQPVSVLAICQTGGCTVSNSCNKCWPSTAVCWPINSFIICF